MGIYDRFLVLFSWGLLREILSQFAKMNPAQTPEAPQSGGSKYRYEVTKSVPGSVGKTLLECIQQNVVEKPPLMSWNSWQKWRVTISPKEGTDGFQQDAAAERSLYLAVMEALYGSDWQTQLAVSYTHLRAHET